jgi:Na+-driven multidrug efflux pump
MRWALDRKLSADIVKLAYPIIFGMLAQTSINLADTIMIGWLDDVTASVAGVAAIGITLPLFWLVGGFVSAIAVGTQALTARRFGENSHDLAGRVLYNSLSIAFSLGIILSIAGPLLIPYVFPFFNNNPDVLKVGIPYAQLRFVGVLSMVATISYKAFFDGIGKTYVHMIASIVMNVSNLVLNAILIFGLLGFPKMGVTGAGVGSLIASYLGLAVIAGWSFRPKLIGMFRYYRKSNFNLFVVREITRLSLPGAFATMFVTTGFLLFLKIVGMIDRAEWLAGFPSDMMIVLRETLERTLDGGTGRLIDLAAGVLPQIDSMTENMRSPVYTAGTKIIFDLMSISFMTAMAIGNATATFVSQNMGRGNPRMAERYGWEAVKIGSGILGIIGLAEVFFPHLFLNLFTDKQMVIDASSMSLRMVGLVNFMIGAGLIFMQALFGAGDSKFVMYVELTLHFGCLVPLAYFFGITLDMKMEGVWLAAMLYIVALSSVLGWKFWQGKWKYIKI